MVALACLVSIVATALLSHSLRTWSAALADDFNWSRTYLTLGILLTALVGLAAPAAGHLTDRFGPRQTVLTGLGLISAGFVVFGLLQAVWVWFTAISIIAMGQMVGGTIPLVVILSRWFVRRRSTAIAATFLAVSIAAPALALLIPWNVDRDAHSPGWRVIAFAFGGIATCVAVLVSSKLHNRPEDLGLQPDGGCSRGAGTETTDFPVGQVLRSRTYWMLIAADFLVTAGVVLLRLYLGPRMTNAGLSLTDVGLVFTVQSLVSMAFIMVGGLAGDRVPKNAALSFFALVQSVGILTIALADSLPMFIVAAALAGIGVGALTPLIWAILPDYFGIASLGKVLGSFLLIHSLIGILSFGTFYVGYLVHFFYSFNPALIVAAGFTFLGALLYRNAHPPEPPNLTSTEQRVS